VLALIAGFAAAERAGAGRRGSLTVIVVEVGEGRATAVPVVGGHVLAEAAASVPFAGADVTARLQDLLDARLRAAAGAAVPRAAAAAAKEAHYFASLDPAADAARVATDPAAFARWPGGAAALGAERFLAPEALFAAAAGADALPALVNAAGRAAPIDTRRTLLGNVVLSGGTTTLLRFAARLPADAQRRVDAQLDAGGDGGVRVEIPEHARRRRAVWLGGSVFAAGAAFRGAAVTRKEYAEHGAACFSAEPASARA
jgi:actin-related protein